MGIDIIIKQILLMYLDTKYEDNKNVNRLGDTLYSYVYSSDIEISSSL